MSERAKTCETGDAMKDVRHGIALDTSEEASRLQIELIRNMPSERRARILSGLCRMVDTLAEAEVRRRYPDASDREVFLRLTARRLGGELALKVYPDLGRLLDPGR